MQTYTLGYLSDEFILAKLLKKKLCYMQRLERRRNLEYLVVVEDTGGTPHYDHFWCERLEEADCITT